MSRIGFAPVPVPSGVEVHIAGQEVSAKGGRGALSLRVADEVSIARENGNIVLRPRNDSKRARMLWGTMRSLVNNLVVGVSNGFTIDLEINGVGYRAALDGSDLVLQLGYSHEVRYKVPEGITVACPRPTAITVSGADRQQVGQVAAEIRSWRKPEPYKGKGIKYAGETLLRKEGKKK